MSKALERDAALFAALGDPTRLALVKKLGDGLARTATTLAEDATVTRQAIVKHLAVLEDAGLVVHAKRGREVLYALDTGRVDDARAFLEQISERWDRAIERLRRHVEGD
jgi:DNA-binding transcriptional ArsR family regulator